MINWPNRTAESLRFLAKALRSEIASYPTSSARLNHQAELLEREANELEVEKKTCGKVKADINTTETVAEKEKEKR